MSERARPASTRTSVSKVSRAPIWVPPVTAPRVPASIFPASTCSVAGGPARPGTLALPPGTARRGLLTRRHLGEIGDAVRFTGCIGGGVSVPGAECLPEPLAQRLGQGVRLGEPDAPQVLSLETQGPASHLDAVRLYE